MMLLKAWVRSRSAAMSRISGILGTMRVALERTTHAWNLGQTMLPNQRDREI